MTDPALHERAESLRSRRVPFVHARVVLAERPTSAKPGDEALVLADGAIEGFVGGQCAESTVRLQALALLSSGESMLLRIAPDAGGGPAGQDRRPQPVPVGRHARDLPRTGAPGAARRRARRQPHRRAMSRGRAALGYEARPYERPTWTRPTPWSSRRTAREEEETLVAAVRAGVPYVGLIASPKRGAAVVGSLDLTDDERRASTTRPDSTSVRAPPRRSPCRSSRR